MLLADGLQNLADTFSPTALYWNPAPANDNTCPERQGWPKNPSWPGSERSERDPAICASTA